MIKVGDKLKYSSGDNAIVICVDKPGRCPIVTHNIRGRLFTHYESGKIYNDSKSNPDDLILPISYEDIPIDTPGYAWNTIRDKRSRYFAGVTTTGIPLTFINGRTSFSKEDTDPVEWNHFEPLEDLRA